MGRRIFLTLLSALAASGFILICTFGQTVRRHKTETKTAAIAASEETEPLYTVMEKDGKIAVFSRGYPKPYMYIDFDASLLTEYDREQLRAGIAIGSDSELRAYIQDMTG